MPTFLETQLQSNYTIITAINQALLEFATNGARQTVSFDSGQSRLSYTRSQISELERTRSRLIAETLELERSLGLTPQKSFFFIPA